MRLLVGDLPLHQHEFDALLDLVYNVGLGNVSTSESPRLNMAIENKDYEAIAAELDYTHAGGKFAQYLFRRHARGERPADRDTARQLIEEAQLFLEATHACQARLASQPAVPPTGDPPAVAGRA